MQTQNLTNILKEGERLYLEEFRTELERAHYGEYAVIDTDTRQYVADPNKLQAIDAAQREFGKKLFYIVRVGDLNQPTINHKMHVSWSF